MMKNECGKTREQNNPYEIWVAGDWEWRVLKKWQVNDDKPRARWFCAVSSPYLPGNEFELGDTYVSEIKGLARKLSPEEMKVRLSGK